MKQVLVVFLILGTMLGCTSKSSNDLFQHFQTISQQKDCLPELVDYMHDYISKVNRDQATQMIFTVRKVQINSLPSLQRKLQTKYGLLAHHLQKTGDLKNVKQIADPFIEMLLHCGYKIVLSEGTFAIRLELNFFDSVLPYAFPDTGQHIK